MFSDSKKWNEMIKETPLVNHFIFLFFGFEGKLVI
jgi:hypothetical protein